jgi:LPXTG-motif cell wall-anchored protein
MTDIEPVVRDTRSMTTRLTDSDTRRRGPGLGLTIVVALIVAAALSIGDARAASTPQDPLGPPIEYAPPEVVDAMATTATPAATTAPANDAELPFTGARTFGLTVLGILIFLAGAALVRRRPRRTS